MSRQHIGLRPPAEGQASQLPPHGWDSQAYRCCEATYPQPWWFSSRADGDGGRFDLTAPRGTCYWARTAAGAIVEKVADPEATQPTVVPYGILQRLSVWETPRPAGIDIADMVVPSVPGLTIEVATIVPYTLPWAWADACDQAGRDGIAYPSRFSGVVCVAVFGPAGIPDNDRRPAATRTSAIDHRADLPDTVELTGVPRADAFTAGPKPSGRRAP